MTAADIARLLHRQYCERNGIPVDATVGFRCGLCRGQVFPRHWHEDERVARSRHLRAVHLVRGDLGRRPSRVLLRTIFDTGPHGPSRDDTSPP